jgi:hypothetical protein
MCEAPSDTLRMTGRDGNAEVYEIYCSQIHRIRGKKARKVDIDEAELDALIQRWTATRQKYCRRGYGCSDAELHERWDFHMELKTDSGWITQKYARTNLEYRFLELIKANAVAAAHVEAQVFVSLKQGKVMAIKFDSSDPGHYAFLAQLEKPDTTVSFDRIFNSKDTSATIKFVAHNYFREN